MLQSETTTELANALCKAQAAMKSAAFNRVNPHFKNKYADLAAIIDAVRGPLTDNGLSFTQTTEVHVDGTFILVTALRHATGQWIASTFPLPPKDEKPQVIGSALTYAKRYTLSSITGIAADEDDDAEATRKTNGNGGVINDLQAEELRQLAVKKKIDVSKLLELTHSESISDIPASVFARAKAWLEKHP